MLDTPVVLIVFRRPSLTQRVLERIAEVRPRKLFVIADGPRPDRPEDLAACRETRALIDRVDWPGEIIKNYSDENLGCGRRPATGIDWVFEQVDRAIILEDDCLPDPSFFRFCEELLERYRDDERVMQIAGATWKPRHRDLAASYYFSRFTTTWGWATWRRAWRHFDFHAQSWGVLRKTRWLQTLVPDEVAVRYWKEKFDGAYAHKGRLDYWDYQWTLACLLEGGLSIGPRENLVSNLGVGGDATHTIDGTFTYTPSSALRFPLVHPKRVAPHRTLDRRYLREVIVPEATAVPFTRLNWVRRALWRRSPRTVRSAYRVLSRVAVAVVHLHVLGEKCSLL